MSLETILKGQKRDYRVEHFDLPVSSRDFDKGYQSQAHAVGDNSVKYFVKTWVDRKNYRCILESEAVPVLMSCSPHPNLLLPEDVVDDKHGLHFVYLVMEGETLDDYMNRVRQTSDLQLVLHILESTAAGLQHVHNSGLVHGDLKPKNIFLQQDLTAPYGIKPVVFDWDFTRIVGKSYPTIAGDIIFGTPHYMAPEQIRLEPFHPSFDLCALGIIVFELLQDNLPVFGLDVSDFVCAYKLPYRNPITVDYVPQALKNVVQRMVAFERKDRYQTLAEMVEAFKSALGTPSQQPFVSPLPSSLAPSEVVSS